jgi:hypothetical protein
VTQQVKLAQRGFGVELYPDQIIHVAPQTAL